jgi:hypothetical protein
MANAELSPNTETSQLWQTIAGSYRFLLEREERIEAQARPAETGLGGY